MADQAARLRTMVRGTGYRGPGTRVIAVSSGKGGVGKTNVTVNLAIALGQAGRRVVLVDGDLGLANVDVVLGISPRYTLEHVIRRQRSLDEIVVDGPPNVRIVPGGSGLQELARLADNQRQTLIRSLARLGEGVDYLLIDTAAGISQDVSEFVLAAQEALIVTTPEPTAIADAYALIKVVTRQTSHPAVHLVVNQATSAAEANDVALKIGAVAERFLRVSVDCAGYLPSDAALPRAVRRQIPVLLAYPSSPFSRLVYALSRQVDGERVERDRDDGVFGFLQRIVGVREEETRRRGDAGTRGGDGLLRRVPAVPHAPSNSPCWGEPSPRPRVSPPIPDTRHLTPKE